MSEFYWDAARLLRERRKAEKKAAAVEDAARAFSERAAAASRPDHYLWTRLEHGIQSACSSPDRPLEFSRDLTCLFNFGSNPTLLMADLALTQAERAGQTIDESKAPEIDSDLRPYHSRILHTMEQQFAENQGTVGVYNFEPWLQETYRDMLDVDARESIWRRVEIVEQEMASVPDRLLSLGLPGPVVGDIMGALSDFNTIQDESREREKRKISVSDPRRYAEVIGRIEKEMEKAEQFVPTLRQGKQSAMRDLFTAWKESTYELVDLKRKVHEMWLADKMDENIQNMQSLLQAARRTLRRCAEDADRPACSLVGAKEGLDLIPRKMLERCFKSLQMFDIIFQTDATADRVERRKYGPLSMLIAPGDGVPRYSEELRAAYDKIRQSDTASESQDSNDISHRANYPLNYIVVPSLASQEDILVTLSEAFLEYKACGCSTGYRGALEDLRRNLPQIFELKLGRSTRNPSRARFAYYLAGFLQWAGTGKAPKMLHLDAFIEWAKARIKRQTMIVTPRRRQIVQDYLEGSPVRRNRILLQAMGGRFVLDVQRLALRVLSRDVPGSLEVCRWLPTELRNSSCLRKAAECYSAQQPGFQVQSVSQLRRFLLSDPELTRIFLGLEARLTGEVAAVRERTLRQHGREISYEKAIGVMREHHEQALNKRRDAVNIRIDRGLLGMLYAIDGNPFAAFDELKYSLDTLSRMVQRKRSDTQELQVGDVLSLMGDRQLYNRAIPRGSAAGQTRAIGQKVTSGPNEDEFILYNLGSMAIGKKAPRLAAKYLQRFSMDAPRAGWWLFAEFAKQILDELDIPEAPPEPVDP